MQGETQTEAILEPENAVLGESAESKSKRGGKRAGAGRKPNLAKHLIKGFSRAAILQAVENVDIGAIVVGLLRSKREKTRLETLVFYRDTFIGRPAQNVSLSGGLVHAHMAWGSLASLSDEEMQTLDAITKKLVAPAANASPDAHQNQIESKPALEAEVVESRA